MVFKKPCKSCNKKFLPTGRYVKICGPCRSKKIKEGMKKRNWDRMGKPLYLREEFV